MSTQPRSLAHKAALALLVLSASIAVLYLMRPIADPDFFWHLKTGQWILQHQSLPAIDPFSLAPPAADDLRASFLLTSYWFSQIIYAALYSLGGWWGIALLRVALVGALAVLFAARCDLRQPAKVSLLLLVAVQILEVYPLERPQVFSFVFFAALLVLLDRYREQGDVDQKTGLYAALVAALMLVWANTHGGFFVGQVTLLLFVVLEGIKFLHPRLSPLSKRRYRGLGLIVGAGWLASFFNPNPLNSFKMLFNIGDTNTFLYATNLEYSSALQIFREHSEYTILLNGLMLALVVGSALISIRRQDIVWLALLAGTAFMGWQHARYLPFFLVASLFYLGKCRYEGAVGTTFKAVLVVSALIAVVWFSRDEVRNFTPFVRTQWGVDRSFPVNAADFVVENKLPGPVYNTYLWGGYLIWRLGPERKIYCDGRALDPNRYREYLSSTIGVQSATPYWKEIFRKNGINTAIVQMKEDGGQMNPLASSLYRDSDWKLVFSQDNAAVFVRKQ
jgi:hypothetical protein